ncbi:MAG: transcription elongation factor GreA [Erysipelotrichaceae bacterium]|nr:transcription elongation factor GreA [Erysipelotrichaceae bacterium]
MEDKYYVTEEGLQKLKEEYDNLVHKVRDEVKQELKEARAQGDLSENADYDAARDRQAQVESRITQLEYQIKNAEIIVESKSTKYVRLGSTVEIQEMDTKNKLTYTIVGSVEADPLAGKLSNVTPLAEAILDQKVGTVVTVEAKVPYEVKILRIL